MLDFDLFSFELGSTAPVRGSRSHEVQSERDAAAWLEYTYMSPRRETREERRRERSTASLQQRGPTPGGRVEIPAELAPTQDGAGYIKMHKDAAGRVGISS